MKKYGMAALAAAYSLLGVLLFALLNPTLGGRALWCIFPIYGLLWVPVSIFFYSRRDYKGFAAVGSAMTVVFLIVVNHVSSPGTPWFWYACYPLVWWPVAAVLGRRAGTVGFALLCGLATVLYYAALNWLLSPGFPWVIFVLFAAAWWPLAMSCARRRAWLGFAVAGSALVVPFFSAVNALTSPGVVWAVYPIFAVLWWPLSVYFFQYKKAKLRA